MYDEHCTLWKTPLWVKAAWFFVSPYASNFQRCVRVLPPCTSLSCMHYASCILRNNLQILASWPLLSNKCDTLGCDGFFLVPVRDPHSRWIRSEACLAGQARRHHLCHSDAPHLAAIHRPGQPIIYEYPLILPEHHPTPLTAASVVKVVALTCTSSPGPKVHHACNFVFSTSRSGHYRINPVHNSPSKPAEGTRRSPTITPMSSPPSTTDRSPTPKARRPPAST
jgi:hypothetical protein